MILRIGYDIQFECPAAVAMVALLHVHPSRAGDLRGPDDLRLEPSLEAETYIDSFGNRCTRFLAPAHALRVTIIRGSDGC